MKTKFIKIITLVFILVFQVSIAQDSVSGTVTDADGIPLPGATVIVQGTSTGVSTDFDGNYQINAAQGETLVFSFVGYDEQTASVDGNTINVSLQTSNELDEVVVVAYGTQSKASLTGSVSVIDAEQIENSTYSNPVKSLEGLVSGLRIVQSNAVPGSSPTIRIRGFGSINASSAPLIVVDGVPFNGSINSINPQDIESTSVLKDASSTSLYGNKASNGVLLINTKKGKKNRKSTITIDSKIGVTQRGAKDYNVTSNPKEFYETYHSIIANSEYYYENTEGSGMTEAQAYQYATDNLVSTVGYNVYDVADADLVDVSGVLSPAANLLVKDYWEDALFRDTADFSSTNLNISGGSDNIDYYFSLGSEENNGYTVRSNFNRHSTRLKLNVNEIAKNISLGADLSYSNTKSQAVPSTFSGGAPASFYSNSFSWARRIAPIYPVYLYDQNWDPILNPNNPSGFEYDMGKVQTFGDGSTRERKYAIGEHPLAVIENTIETNEGDIFNGSIRAKIDLPYGIQFEYVSNYLTQANKFTDFSGPGSGAFAQSNNGLLTNSRNNFSAFTNQQLLTWKNETDGNSFDFLDELCFEWSRVCV